MQANSVADPRPFRVVLAAAVGVLLLVIAVAGFGSWRDLESSREREAGLEAKVEGVRERIDQLERRAARLAEDPAAIDELAREELWMAHPTDTVILLPPEEQDAAPAPAEPSPSPTGP